MLSPQQPTKPKPGSTVISAFRPTNPAKDTSWKNPATGLTETFNGKEWIEDPVSAALQASNNLSDVANVPSARANLGLGSIATQNANDVSFSGRIRFGAMASKGVDYAMGSGDCTINGTGGALGITITLPAANLLGQIAIIRKVDAGVGTVTYAAAGVDTIEGLASGALVAQFDKTFLQSNGSGTWYRIV